ncbi:Uncharacterised protein r2_g4138 [Pycnogonum litorale]
MGGNPIKLTLSAGSTTPKVSSSPITAAASTVQPGVSSQKVILVSSSGNTLTPSILHKSLSIPVVKTVSTTKTTISPAVASSKHAGISSVSTPVASYSTFSKHQTPKSRTVTIPARGKSKQQSIVIPVGTGTQQQGTTGKSGAAGSRSLQQASYKNFGRPAVQLKQDGSLKIITRTVPSGKLVSKSISGSRSMTLPSGIGNARVVNVITTQAGGRGVIGAGMSSDPSVVVVNAKALQSGTFKLESASNVVRQAVSQVIAAGGGINKPNVIVVKQSQLFPGGTSASGSGNIVGRVVYSTQKALSAAANAVTGTAATGSSSNRLSTVTAKIATATEHSLLRSLSLPTNVEQSVLKTSSSAPGKSKPKKPNTLLADLMQATGIYGDVDGQQVVDNQPQVSTGDSTVANNWIEYDTLTPAQFGDRIVSQEGDVYQQTVSSKNVDDTRRTNVLEQIPEGSVFEINSPEVAELLTQSGKLSAEETMKFLKQAGYDITAKHLPAEQKSSEVLMNPAKEMIVSDLDDEQAPVKVQVSLPDALMEGQELSICQSTQELTNQKQPLVVRLSNKDVGARSKNTFHVKLNPSESQSVTPEIIKVRKEEIDRDDKNSSDVDLEHQAFLEQVVQELQKQQNQNAADRPTSNTSVKCDVDVIQARKIDDPEKVNDVERPMPGNDVGAEINSRIDSVDAYEDNADVDAFQFVDEMLDPSFISTPASEGLISMKLIDSKTSFAKPEQSFIRLQDLDGTSKKQLFKIHRLTTTASSTTCHSNSKDYVNSTLNSIGCNDVTVDSSAEIVLQPDEKSNFVDVYDGLPSNSNDVVTKSALKRPNSSLATEEFLRAVDNTQQMDACKLNLDLLTMASNISLVSPVSEQSIAVTEVTHSVNAPMVVSQIVERTGKRPVIDDRNVGKTTTNNSVSTTDVESRPATRKDIVGDVVSSDSSPVQFSADTSVPSSSSFSTGVRHLSVSFLDSQQRLQYSSASQTPEDDSTMPQVQSSVPSQSNGSVEKLSSSDGHIFPSKRKDDVQSSSDIMSSISSTSSDEKGTSSMPSSSSADIDSTSVDNVDIKTDDGQSKAESVDSTSFDKQSVDLSADVDSTVLRTSPIKTKVNNFSVAENSDNVAVATVDSTSDERKSIRQLNNDIDSTTIVINRNNNQSSSSSSSINAFTEDDKTVQLSSSNQITIGGCRSKSAQLSPMPRICKAPSDFIVSSNQSYKRQIDSLSEPTSTVAVVSRVTVESEGIDTTNMKMEDYSSQRLCSDGGNDVISSAVVTDDESNQSVSTANSSSSLNNNSSDKHTFCSSDSSQHVNRRKRKATDEQSSSHASYSGHIGSWVRSAIGLLGRVSKFRGSGKTKCDQDASHWFLHPVSIDDVPDYLSVIKQPMDFSTIRNKLETGQYQNVNEFHKDMLLVKNNCEIYNPPEHRARIDCKEVFNFYFTEFEKLTEKWQRSHIMSSSPKKQKNQ